MAEVEQRAETVRQRRAGSDSDRRAARVLPRMAESARGDGQGSAFYSGGFAARDRQRRSRSGTARCHPARLARQEFTRGRIDVTCRPAGASKMETLGTMLFEIRDHVAYITLEPSRSGERDEPGAGARTRRGRAAMRGKQPGPRGAADRRGQVVLRRRRRESVRGARDRPICRPISSASRCICIRRFIGSRGCARRW